MRRGRLLRSKGENCSPLHRFRVEDRDQRVAGPPENSLRHRRRETQKDSQSYVHALVSIIHGGGALKSDTLIDKRHRCVSQVVKGLKVQEHKENGRKKKKKKEQIEFNILAVMKQVDIKSEVRDVLNAVLPLLKLHSIAHYRWLHIGIASGHHFPASTSIFPVHRIMTVFGNTGNLPLSIVTSVCHSQDNPFGPKCHVSGVAYVAFSQWASTILFYTLVYHMMEPPLEYHEIIEEEAQIEIEELPANDLSRPLLVEAEWPGMEDNETEHCKTPFIARLFNNISGVSNMNNSEFKSTEDKNPGCNSESIRCLAEPKMVRKIRIVAESTPIRHILQPPIIVSLLAIVIRVFPGLKAFVFRDDAVFSFITVSLAILADAMVPSPMAVLGGMLAEGTIGIIVARLLVLPLVGIAVVLLADRLNLLVPGDQLYKFVLLLQYTTPSAILLGATASLRGYVVREASALLFWQHIFAVFSLSLYITLYFKMLLASI
ncbi:hypothetical protein FEM48_Zijuj04G0179100 [Ziziphus jujuba var. spinosa]|uniref:Protein PIN-LIKES 2-like n=1 Tax=Ziziphus jujuba var. spinosa TaxID=714518 RepID=A0A978VLB6_ZIZJJ|nr:hypothetical protein FEM48_Zijuj04G0179100 [Ziziphus jujuba var. spinosa]